MNGKLWLTVALVAAASLGFPGCLDKYEVTTWVFTDGTCERVITVSRDSRRLPSSAFPIPVDSTWQCSWTAKSKQSEKGNSRDSSKEYVYTARKHFADFDALSREYKSPRDSASFAIHVHIEKKFRWFYTYYVYTETYDRFDPLHYSVPPSAVMTEEEIQRFMSSEKPDSLLKAKWKEWENKNLEQWAFARLLEAVRSNNDPALPVSVFEANRERLIRLLSSDSTYVDATSRANGRKGSARAHEDQENSAHDAIKVLASALKTDAVWALRPAMDSLMIEMQAREEVTSRAEGEYTNTVVMPGVILETNAGELRGTTVVWRFTYKQLALREYAMNVESRVVNLWIMIGTALAVVVALLLPVFLRRRFEELWILRAVFLDRGSHPFVRHPRRRGPRYSRC